MAEKLKLYLVERYYVRPACVLVIASTREEAIELSDKKHGAPAEGSTAKRIKFKKAKVLHY